MLALAATGPGPHTFESVGAPLPDGLELDPATGIIQGVPTAAALLANTPAGEWAGVIVRVGDGRDQVDTDAFSISVVGAPLPAPYAYMAFDDGDLDDAFGARGIPTGTVMPGEAGVIGGAVFVAGAESYVKYPSTLSSRINGKSGVTVATTMKTTSAGTMLFNLSDQFTHWCRVYLGMVNGRLELGGRSQNSNAEAYRAVFGDIPVNDGTFHTVIGVVDLASDRASLYVDGLPDASRTMGFGRTTYESFTPADQNVLGHISTLADSPLAPNVVHDELALWDVALDAREAATVAWLLRRGIALREWIGF